MLRAPSFEGALIILCQCQPDDCSPFLIERVGIVYGHLAATQCGNIRRRIGAGGSLQHHHHALAAEWRHDHCFRRDAQRNGAAIGVVACITACVDTAFLGHCIIDAADLAAELALQAAVRTFAGGLFGGNARCNATFDGFCIQLGREGAGQHGFFDYTVKGLGNDVFHLAFEDCCVIADGVQALAEFLR